LENVIERSFALSASDTIAVHDLPPQLFRDPEEALAAVQPMEDLEETGGGRGPRNLLPPARAARALPNPVPRPTVPAAASPLMPTGAQAPVYTEPFVPKAPEQPATLDEMEKRQILDALRRAKGKKVEASRILGIDRKRLYRKMKKYGLE
jgi:transcriptional regulator of acetoin/glycerol metabolism